MDKIKNECEGCKMYYRKTSKCNIDMVPYITDEIQCPCMICLVKGICNTVCDAFLKHSSASFRHENRKAVVNHSTYMQRILIAGDKREW